MTNTPYYVGAAVLVLLIVVIVWFSDKSGAAGGACAAGMHYACKDKWFGPDGAPLSPKPEIVCGADGTPEPGVGPSNCTVSCPAGTNPCWNPTLGSGACVKGSSCPCNSSSECKNGGTCDPKRSTACICRPGFTGAQCEIAATPCGALCGRGGECVGGACVCKTGWNPVAQDGDDGKACESCLPNRGPPGNCGGVIVTGLDVPLPTNVEYCNNVDFTRNSTYDRFCSEEFGTQSGAHYGGYCEGGGNACYAIWEGTYQAYCTFPKGIWVDPKADNSIYTPCNKNGENGVAVRPNGYIAPVI